MVNWSLHDGIVFTFFEMLYLVQKWFKRHLIQLDFLIRIRKRPESNWRENVCGSGEKRNGIQTLRDPLVSCSEQHMKFRMLFRTNNIRRQGVNKATKVKSEPEQGVNASHAIADGARGKTSSHGRFLGKRKECYNCKETTHLVKDCKNKRYVVSKSCYICGEFGHVASGCKDRVLVPGACFKCGALDHSVVDCPDRHRVAKKQRLTSLISILMYLRLP